MSAPPVTEGDDDESDEDGDLHDDAEPRVLRSAPWDKPDPAHGWVYLVLGSLAAGAPRWEPNPAWTAARLAQPWRYEQQRIALEDDRAAA